MLRCSLLDKGEEVYGPPERLWEIIPDQDTLPPAVMNLQGPAAAADLLGGQDIASTQSMHNAWNNR